MQFSFSTPREIAQGMKRIWESKMVTPSSAQMIEDVDLALKALEIVYLANGASVERLADRNRHRQKVLGEGDSVSWGGARTKGEVHKPKFTNKMFLHSDLLKSLSKNILLVSLRLCTSPLVCAPLQTDTFHFTYHPFNAPAYAR